MNDQRYNAARFAWESSHERLLEEQIALESRREMAVQRALDELRAGMHFLRVTEALAWDIEACEQVYGLLEQVLAGDAVDVRDALLEALSRPMGQVAEDLAKGDKTC